jgi:hypothetical protein
LGAIHKSSIPHRQHYLPEFEAGEKSGDLEERMLIVQGVRRGAVILTARSQLDESEFRSRSRQDADRAAKGTHAPAGQGGGSATAKLLQAFGANLLMLES